MTTPAAERLYQAQHLLEMEGRKPSIFNPHARPFDELPVIYGFNNGGSPGWYSAVAIAEDGTYLGSHCCSHECYMENDLGILDGTRTDRHENDYQKHYPDGYRMEFVSSAEIKQHPALNLAFKRNQEQPASYDLACHFLDDVKGSTQADRNRLASTIQQAIEEWLADRESDRAQAALNAYVDSKIDERRIEGKQAAHDE